jgi:sugar lactone lactonase YvrE
MMYSRTLVSALTVVTVTLAFASHAQEKAPAKPAEPAKPTAPAKPAPSPAPALTITGFQTPESVLFDEAGDRYLVSNINGSPLEKDNNGYLSVLSPDGKITTEKWIAGGQNGVTLNAPKGTAIAKGVLYVSDIDVVRTFDAKTGAPKGDIEVKGASFLNDVVAGADGKIYVSDSGMKQGAKDFEPTGTDGVWVISGKKATPFFANKDLKGPNGVAFSGKDLVVCTFGANELYKLDAKKGKLEVTTAPNGGLDGLVVGKDGTVWVSSWGGQAIYKGKLGGTFEAVVTNVSGPADFGLDTKRNRILVPRFMDNAVDVFDVK